MSFTSSFSVREGSIPLTEKIRHIPFGLLFLICCVAGIGFIALYSAGGGSLDPWAYKHLLRFCIMLCLSLVIALVDVRFYAKISYLAYVGVLLLLVAVELMGEIGMGAQRWINLGVIQLQPSELMKIVVIMALARYFHARSLEEVRRWRTLIFPVALIILPVIFVLLQPDLGTSLMIIMAGVAILWLVGVRWWKFATGIVLTAGSIPVVYHFLHDYQKKRIQTFLDPESDPLGAGYHIMQSKIALGSGGIKGKGFLEGTQSNLNFLPEKQTDFIFTLFAEEWGLTGGIVLLTLFGIIFFYGFVMAFQCRHHYGRILVLGLIINFSLYIFINIAMIMGLMPVVGVPLPLISYGGTAMLTIMISLGLMMSAFIHRDVKIQRYLS